MFGLRGYSLLGIFIWCVSFLHGQNHTSFRHLSPINDNKFVIPTKTAQGSFDNIWMLCADGILVYNGYDYKLIKNKMIFPNIDHNDFIKNMLVDHNKNIWVTSQFGLISRYVAITNQFEDITPLLPKNDGISSIVTKKESIWLASKLGNIYQYIDSKMNFIATISHKGSEVKNIIDIDVLNSSEVYVGTNSGTIYSYSLKTEQVTELIGPFTNYPGNIILAADLNNKLWVGTETYGLFVYDPISKQFIEDSFFEQEKFNINKEMFLSLFCSKDGYMWGGTDGGGLYKVNINSGEVDLFTRQYSNEFSLSSNTILDINEDNHRNMWITTNYGKLNILPNRNNNIRYHEGSVNNTPLRVLSILKSSKDVLWIGTDGSGLTKVTYTTDGTTKEKSYFSDISLNRGFYIQSITEDNLSNVWFGTYKNGLWHHNTSNNTFQKISVYNSNKQEATDIRTVFSDSKGRIWIGSNLSINIYSPDLKLIAVFDNNSKGLKGPNTESILEDRNGIIWLGLYNGGLFQFNEHHTNISNSTFIDYSQKNKNYKDEIRAVKSMVLGNPGEIWLINRLGKLLKFNTKDKTYTTFEHIESIGEKSFIAILKDNNDDLWMSSKNNGISHLDVKNLVLKTYYDTDGLQDNVFLQRSNFKDEQGLLYFGGVKGLNSFDPKHLNKKASNTRLYINSIEILNQPVYSLLPNKTTTGIANTESLKLKHNQSHFSFRFYAIGNILNPSYYYTYRLKGFDKNWITSRSERLATYTNIPPGNYTFEVKTGTKKGVWELPEKKIAITIQQPIWNTPWAYIFYLFIFILAIYGVRRWYSMRKNLFLEKVSHKKETELHDLKMNFFAKMSHEIQTPITLILGPIDDMLKKAEKNGNLLLKQRLEIMSYNTKRLSKIAQELTLVRNKELETLRLTVTKNNLCKDIENISISFKELARKRKIDFIVNCPKNLTATWYDKEKLEHVIYNLLSNAFKFTPKEGNIILNIVPVNNKKFIKLSVIDSGPGIPDEELQHIFKLFYQSDIGKKNKGTGIGLALTKELVNLHRGKIKVNSNPIEGTTFIIKFPITENAYTETERIITDDTEEPNNFSIVENNTLIKEKELDLSKKTILIVEDNFDLQAFLKELLQLKYNIIMAENGEEGYYYAKNNLPDLILSDIVMPKLDGIEMSKKLQKDPVTMHIPIILLTAKNSTNAKISGLKSGAIEYINKPFNTNELLLKVKNIISSKEYIISKYRKEIISSPKVKLEKSQDEIFLENLVSNINLRLDDADFKMEELAESLHMGYSSLYRKCHALTGNSLVDFVRLLRLKKAAVLITKYGYNISEASFMTGFNDPKYFSKCFKKYFKKTPIAFKKEANKIGAITYLKKHGVDTTF
ncbi:signal transduction histidine kinase [Aquimarina sp. MAR_2010_214]|uniref:ATP-binding protein n=1 Tax=Aquimarina sp. MAR_2010_214 TaxID=1250026 RepID=UPI000CB028B4|nr:ATP-binding protein [Aquimarina sp. MAR_2010_214]PKV52588.1 signal transduction histidine kinase [Aquimarina sp. MAR_2010_214]